MRELFFIALIVACPLLMMLMMRHGHGHGAHAGSGHHGRGDDEPQQDATSTEELRRRRDELGRLIEEREGRESERPPIGARR